MGQKGQRSDTHTLTHEAQTLTRDVVTAPFRLRTYRLIRKILIGFILVSIANVLFSYFFYTPKMYRIIRENRDLVIKYRILQDRIRTAQRHVDEIRHRDNYVYRSLFSTDTMSIEGVWQPYPDTKYAALLDDDYAPLMVGTWRQLDALARTLYLESVSFDELQAFSQDKEKMSAAVPAIWPIDRSALHNNHIGAFSPRRYHPVLHRVQAHTGVDFGCDRGTPVYATGDGEVELAVGSGYNGGYGYQVLRKPRFRLQDPLRPPEQGAGQTGRTRDPRSGDRRNGQHGPFDRPPSPLRSDSQGYARESGQLFQPRHDRRRIRRPDGADA